MMKYFNEFRTDTEADKTQLNEGIGDLAKRVVKAAGMAGKVFARGVKGDKIDPMPAAMMAEEAIELLKTVAIKNKDKKILKWVEKLTKIQTKMRMHIVPKYAFWRDEAIKKQAMSQYNISDAEYDEEENEAAALAVWRESVVDYTELQEGKVEGKHLKNMMSLTKNIMREITMLEKGDDAADLHDQITNMHHFAKNLRDVITRAGRVNPK